MEAWLSWIVGFFIWVLCVLVLAIITFLIAQTRTPKLRGKIPDAALDYHYRPDFIPKDAFLLDTHSHTIASDGWMTPEQNIKWHIANGFNAFVLTDHNTGKNNAEIMALQEKYPEILIIPGYEWTTWRVHINFLGIMDFPGAVPNKPSDQEIISTIHKAKELGAVVQIDHISWTVNEPLHRAGEVKHPTRDQLYEWGIDGYEINNEMRWYDPKTLHWLENLKQTGKYTHPVYLATGTDIHSPLKEWATGWTEILLTDEEKQRPKWEYIKIALLEGRTRIWVDHDYRQPPENTVIPYSEQGVPHVTLSPFYGLAHSIEKLPGSIKGIVIYVLWFLIAYFPLRLIFTWLLSI